MLLNLSNHPSKKWSDTQHKIATKLYGSIEDIAFPQIDPKSDLAGVEKLAKSYYADIMKMTETKKMTVHLMGEMTFTYTLVSMLKKANIPCVASTTIRIAEEKDGKKITRFQFSQFRPYF